MHTDQPVQAAHELDHHAVLAHLVDEAEVGDPLARVRELGEQVPDIEKD